MNRYVDIFAYTFGVQRADLNVVSLDVAHNGVPANHYRLKTAAAKGLVAGGFSLMRPDGTIVYRGPEAVEPILNLDERRLIATATSYRRCERGTSSRYLKHIMDPGSRERS